MSESVAWILGDVADAHREWKRREGEKGVSFGYHVFADDKAIDSEDERDAGKTKGGGEDEEGGIARRDWRGEKKPLGERMRKFIEKRNCRHEVALIAYSFYANIYQS